VLFFLNPSYYLESLWFPAKLALVCVLIVYHIICRQMVVRFRLDKNSRDHRWYRYFNEAPSLLLMGIVILVVVKI
jgi:putative membrane protein